MEGWLLVEREGGRGGKDVLVCVHLTRVKILVWWTVWMDSVDGWCGWSAAAEFELGKLTLKMPSVRDMVHACTDLVYINPTPSSVGGGTPPPHIINKVLIW